MSKRILATVLLSALAILWPHNGQTPVNNSTTARAKAQTVQVQAPEKALQQEATTLTDQKTEVVPEPQPTPQVEVAQPLSDKESLMQQAGISQSDWAATDYIVSHESSWNSAATNPSSGAYGLCQALPASKMASAGDDYKSNPVTQLKWCHDYANNRYGGWWKSFAYWEANRWW